jgi:hypothetical protein
MYVPAVSRTIPVALLLGALGMWVPLAGEAGPPPEENVEVLIKLLGSRHFKERDRATKLLVERKDAVAALHRASRSADLEVKRRIEGIFKERERRQAQRHLERLKRAVRTGALDEAAVLVARWPAGYEEAACWAEVRKLAVTLLELHRKDGGKAAPRFLADKALHDPRLFKILTQERVAQLPPDYDPQKFLFIRAGDVDLWGVGGEFPSGLVAACSGSFRARGFNGGMILAGGPVDVDYVMGDTIIVSDADVKIGMTCCHCLTIARGVVTCDGPVGGQILTRKKVITTRRGRLIRCNVTDGDPNPLGFVRFFGLTHEGLDVKEGAGGVHVAVVREDSPFARALKPGDLITGVDGAAVRSEEELRRLLRRAEIREEEVVLRLLRGGKARGVRFPNPR